MRRLASGSVSCLAAALTLAACGGSGGSHGAMAPGSTAAPASSGTTAPPPAPPPPSPPPPYASPGTSGGSGGIAGVTPGQIAVGLALDPADPSSRFGLYVPRSAASGPTGLVLALHGVEGSANQNPTGWFQLCVQAGNRDRFIVVGPYGDTSDGGSGAWTQPWAREIVELVRSRYDVDLRREYVAALSGGCLPAIWYGLGTSPTSYGLRGHTIRAGFQQELAAIAFSSPAYTPGDAQFAQMTSRTAAQLGFVPSLWADYGELSNDGGRALALEAFGTAHGYAPSTAMVRPGEGHAPGPPFTATLRMFDRFAATSR